MLLPLLLLLKDANEGVAVALAEFEEAVAAPPIVDDESFPVVKIAGLCGCCCCSLLLLLIFFVDDEDDEVEELFELVMKFKEIIFDTPILITYSVAA